MMNILVAHSWRGNMRITCGDDRTLMHGGYVRMFSMPNAFLCGFVLWSVTAMLITLGRIAMPHYILGVMLWACSSKKLPGREIYVLTPRLNIMCVSAKISQVYFGLCLAQLFKDFWRNWQSPRFLLGLYPYLPQYFSRSQRKPTRNSTGKKLIESYKFISRSVKPGYFITMLLTPSPAGSIYGFAR